MVDQFRFSPAEKPPLRVGLLLDGYQLSGFFSRIIEDIQASNFARLEMLVFRKKAPVEPAPAKKSRTGNLIERIRDPKQRSHILYEMYLKLDQRMRPPNHPLDRVDCSKTLAGIESIEVEPIGKKFVHRFPPEALEKIRAKDLDVILRFGFNILHGEILQSARYGVWSYHHGDNDSYRGGPPHFWALVEKAPLSGVILQVLTEELDGGLALCKSMFTTSRSISVSRNRYVPYWGSTDMVIRKLNELHQFGWEYVKEHAVPVGEYRGKRKIYRSPENADMARWLGPHFFRSALRYPVRQKTVQHWQIALRKGGPPLHDSAQPPDAGGFRWVESPAGHFWADPFAIEHAGRNWVFYEDYSYSKKRAGIACAELQTDGSLGPAQACLEGDTIHFSYPHVFHAQGTLWMSPETANSKSVDLYACEEFPSRWKKQATLLEGNYVDPTIWQHDGQWWMTVTSADPDSRSGCLLLFYADSPAGKWQFHPANPISTDIRTNRGAGKVFQSGAALIRPFQSGCPIYGYSFGFQQITMLTRKRYEETALRVINPDLFPGRAGVHTYGFVGDIEIIDGQSTRALKRVMG